MALSHRTPQLPPYLQIRTRTSKFDDKMMKMVKMMALAFGVAAALDDSKRAWDS